MSKVYEKHLDRDKKIYYVTAKDLNENAKRQLQEDKIGTFDINYMNVHGAFRVKYGGFARHGYSLVFKHEGKNVLLIFNRNSRQRPIR